MRKSQEYTPSNRAVRGQSLTSSPVPFAGAPANTAMGWGIQQPPAHTAHFNTQTGQLDGSVESKLEPQIPYRSQPNTNGVQQSQPPNTTNLPQSSSDHKFSAKAPGAILTGKQEHYLKRELISQQTQWEINELSSPTALRRFGAPFKSDIGEVSPEDSELPLLRYIFVHHVRNFPFLDQAKEKEFWQDRLQVFLESFATKRISSSEDRLEETKRRKLAIKAQKVVELMMVSGIPTASGYEERIRFSEMEVIDRGANEEGLVANVPQGHMINGWDVNVAGVRTTYIKRTIRQHPHAEFILRVKERGKPEHFVARRYGDFAKMHKNMRLELPGKTLPPLPRKNKKSTGAFLGVGGGHDDDDDDSDSSTGTQASDRSPTPTKHEASGAGGGWGTGGFMSYLGMGNAGHRRNSSQGSGRSTPVARSSLSLASGYSSPNPGRTSTDSRRESHQLPHSPQHHVLRREEQRVSLRAFLRTFLANEQIARSNTMRDFLSQRPITLVHEDLEDITRRVELDDKRMEEGRKFYEVARKRARELDVHMEKFRRDIVESNGLSKLFKEIRVKSSIAELSSEYQKFAEWMRIEVAATIYHLFLSDDNSPEMFAQARRIHSLMPYTALKNVIRFTNPAAVMKGVLDLFLAQPLGAKSLMQRIFGLAIGDGIRMAQKQIDVVQAKINEPLLCDKVKAYVAAPEAVKDAIRKEAADEDIDIMIVLLRSEAYQPILDFEQVGRIFNAYVAWNNVVDNVDHEMIEGATLFSSLKSLLKLQTRHRDKQQMLSIIEEPVTMSLFRDLFTIFYEPLVRVYKSANVYNSVTDFSAFADDAIKVVEAAQRQDVVSSDPNETVQAFIDLCQRHEESFYRFVHEVHIHDNGLFDQLMGWLEGILNFLRNGPRNGMKLDMNALLQGAVDMRRVGKEKCIREIDELIEWQMARKKWHNDKTRRKMAGGGDEAGGTSTPAAMGLGIASAGADAAGVNGFRSSDFGINEYDIQDLGLGESDAEEDREEDEREQREEEEGDPIEVERRRRRRLQEALRSRNGEPVKPAVSEVGGLRQGFVDLLRMVLAG